MRFQDWVCVPLLRLRAQGDAEDDEGEVPQLLAGVRLRGQGGAGGGHCDILSFYNLIILSHDIYIKLY